MQHGSIDRPRTAWLCFQGIYVLKFLRSRAGCLLNACCMISADQSAAKYILLGREDIAASMLCMADALQSKAAEQQGGQMPPSVQDSMPSIESTPISMLHTPQLRDLSRITTGSAHSTPRSQKAGVHSTALWPCSVNGTPVQPVVGHNVCEQWSSRCDTPLLLSVQHWRYAVVREGSAGRQSSLALCGLSICFYISSV